MLAGRMQESLLELKQAQRFDPLSQIVNIMVGWNYYLSRRHNDAIKECLKVIELDADFSPAHDLLARTYAHAGMYEEAISAARKTVSDPSDSINPQILGLVYALTGHKSQALKVIDELIELSKKRYVDPTGIALIYAGLGENDLALSWLERGYAGRSHDLVWLRQDPIYDRLRSDPRFDDLARRVGFPPA